MLNSTNLFDPGYRVTDSNGDPVSGAKIKAYLSGTSTPTTLYADSALTTSLGSTVTCDSGGYPTSDGSTKTLVWMGTAAIKIVLTDSTDSTISTHDGITGAISSDDLSGGMEDWTTPVTSLAVDTTLTSTHYGKLIQADPTGGAFTITLPSAITAGDGARIGVRCAATTNQVKVATQGAQTIKLPGSSTTAGVSLLGLGHTMWFVSDGANWSQDIETLPIGRTGIILVTDRLTAAPASPTGGARYIINGTPTGTWLTNGYAQHDLVEADGQGGWIKYTPADGWFAYVLDENLYTSFTDTAWVDQTGMTAPSSSTLKTAVFTDSKSSGTAGGTATSAAWTTRTLQTSEVNTITGCSLASNTVSLAAGTYLIKFSSVYTNASDFRTRFKSTTTSTAIYSLNEFIIPGTSLGTARNGGIPSVGHGVLTLASAEDFKLEYYLTSAAGRTDDLGAAMSLASINEVYARVEILSLTALQGPTGAAGAQGNTGRDAGVGRWTYSTTTTVGAASGTIRFNNATLSSATELYINETDADSVALAATIQSWDDSTSTIKGFLTFRKQDAPGTFVQFSVSGTITDNGTDNTVTVAYVSGSTSLSASDSMLVSFSRNGDAGTATIASIQVILDGAGTAIPSNTNTVIQCPFNCTITGVEVLTDQTGSMVIDVQKDTYANYPPTGADSICAAAKPTLSSATKYLDSTLTGWTTTITAGDILRFNVDSCSTITRATLALTVTKT